MVAHSCNPSTRRLEDFIKYQASQRHMRRLCLKTNKIKTKEKIKEENDMIVSIKTKRHRVKRSVHAFPGKPGTHRHR